MEDVTAKQAPIDWSKANWHYGRSHYVHVPGSPPPFQIDEHGRVVLVADVNTLELILSALRATQG